MTTRTGPLGRRRRHVTDVGRRAELLAASQLRRRPFGDLSVGRQPGMLVARTLAHGPDVLHFDDPITSLDPPAPIRVVDVSARVFAVPATFADVVVALPVVALPVVARRHAGNVAGSMPISAIRVAYAA